MEFDVIKTFFNGFLFPRSSCEPIDKLRLVSSVHTQLLERKLIEIKVNHCNERVLLFWSQFLGLSKVLLLVL
jgi:hypothetical protein